MNALLVVPFTYDDIHEALQAMASTKTSSPDGLPVLFYQKYWHIIGQDINIYCLNVLHGGTSLADINNTNIMLILKITNPIRIT